MICPRQMKPFPNHRINANKSNLIGEQMHLFSILIEKINQLSIIAEFRMMSMKLYLLIWPMVNHLLPLLLLHRQHYRKRMVPIRTNNKKPIVIYVNVHFVINIFSKLISPKNMVYSISPLRHRTQRKINRHHRHQQHPSQQINPHQPLSVKIIAK